MREGSEARFLCRFSPGQCACWLEPPPHKRAPWGPDANLREEGKKEQRQRLGAMPTATLG